MRSLILIVISLCVGYYAGAEVLRYNIAQAFQTGEGAALCTELQKGK